MAERPHSMSFDSVSRGSRDSYIAVAQQDEIPEHDEAGGDETYNRKARHCYTAVNLDEDESSDKQEANGNNSPLRKKPPGRPSAILHRSGSILCLVILYVGLAIFAWVVTCYLSFRPITTSHYDLRDDDNSNYGPAAWSGGKSSNLFFAHNERWYRAARIIQSIVSVATIPLTSAVCSSCAVIFIQRRAKNISIRQVMTLADKGWTDLSVYAKTMAFFAEDGWKIFGSSFLLLAIFVNLLGSVISPLQQLFLSTRTIKIPTEPGYIGNVLDLPNQFQGSNRDDSNKVVAMTRSVLTSTTLVERQAQLWQGGNVSCNYQYHPKALEFTIPESCLFGGVSLANYSELVEPFLAEFPSDYNTGLYSQYIPRVNSTARYKRIPADNFPAGCEKIEGAFYVHYFNTTDDGYGYTWGLQACMPRDLRASPWRSTRDRQDFTEEIYLNVSLSTYELTFSNTYKLTVGTTAGYFELPNYMNGNTAGPLLEKDPNSSCGENCETESTDFLDENHKIGPKRHESTVTNDQSLPLEVVRNKGPLLTIAMALFGEGSFIDSRQTHPSAYISVVGYNNSGEDRSLPAYTGSCIGLAPLASLLTDAEGQDDLMNSVSSCITNSIGSPDSNDASLFQEMADWLSFFDTNEARLTNAFNAAAFVANRVWLEDNADAAIKSLDVNFDLGADTQVPAISNGGLIFISLLLGLYILILVPLAVYAASTPRWTAQLDSFAMMRIGAAISDRLPLAVGENETVIKGLNEIPGWVGDVTDEKEPLGRLGLGAARPLASRKNRRFECDKEDSEGPTCEEETQARLNAARSNS